MAICGGCSKWKQSDLYGNGTCSDFPWLHCPGNSPAGYKSCYCNRGSVEPLTPELRNTIKNEVLSLIGIVD